MHDIDSAGNKGLHGRVTGLESGKQSQMSPCLGTLQSPSIHMSLILINLSPNGKKSIRNCFEMWQSTSYVTDQEFQVLCIKLHMFFNKNLHPKHLNHALLDSRIWHIDITHTGKYMFTNHLHYLISHLDGIHLNQVFEVDDKAPAPV